MISRFAALLLWCLLLTPAFGQGRIDLNNRGLALGYVANGPDEGAPRPGYLQRILTGARHHDLPAAAITEVESLNQQWA